MKITAPFTAEQVDALNRWQHYGFSHEFTCPNDVSHDEAGRILVATTSGWHCPWCGYTQNWAHDFMLEKQTNPMDRLR